VILHMLQIGATMAYQDPLAGGSTAYRSCRRPTMWSRRKNGRSCIGGAISKPAWLSSSSHHLCAILPMRSDLYQ
jgi:hypothetical protein